MNKGILLAAILVLFAFTACADKGDTKDIAAKDEVKVITGADRIVSDSFGLIKDKKLGIVTNHTGLLADGTHLVDTLANLDSVEVVALFGPEHGIRGDAADGRTISHGIDTKTGLPVYSLYGKIRKPTEEMLKDVDMLVFDIQDIGARFYTYISTMYYIIQAGAENDIPVIILDRPNPITGVKIDGPIVSEKNESFVGIAPIPIMHGMTVGELAKMFNEEHYIGEKTADLTVVKMENWEREYYYDECNIPWVKPSPNMPVLSTAVVYPGMCFIEGTNISEGRGTMDPFLQIGAPFIDSEKFAAFLNEQDIKGIEFLPVKYTPVSIDGMAFKPKYENEECNGVKLRITDRNEIEPVKLGVKVLYALQTLYPDNLEIKSRINRLYGRDYLREDLLAGKKPGEIMLKWQDELKEFITLRDNYLLY